MKNTYLRGTDVSVAQCIVPWAKLKAEHIDFAFIKAHEGNSGADPNLAANVAGARAAGVEPIAYCFAYPLPHLDPRAQAAAFVATCDRVGLGSRPMALDLEWPPPVGVGGKKGWPEWKCSAGQINEFNEILAGAVHEMTGFRPVLYTYPWWWRTVALNADVSWAADYPLWLASYVAKEPVPGVPAVPPNMLRPWASWAFWQWDGNGGAKFPNGADADFNVFNGGSEAFDLWLAGQV